MFKHISTVCVCLFLTASFSSCQSAIKSKKIITEWEGEKIYFSRSDVHRSNAYSLYRIQQKTERAKIQYLINMTRDSEHVFIRNKEVFSAQKAAKWIEYKLDRYHDEAKTAYDFATKVACFSKKTGKQYYMVMPDYSLAPVRTIFINELERLDKIDASSEGVDVEDEAESGSLVFNETKEEIAP